MSDILLTEQTSASATPAAGRVVIYPKNDGYLYFKNDTGVETRVNPQTVATAAEWTSANPTLAAGVFGVESDTMKFKIGDGSTAWTALAYWRYTAEHITIATTGGNTNLTTPQSRASSMAVTGVLTSNVNIITPDVMALFVAENLTTGAFTVTFKTAAGSGVAIEQGEHAILYADGTNMEKPDPSGVGSNLTLARIAESTYSTIQHWRNNLASAGIITGGVISDAGGATINVTGGSCAIRPTTSHLSTLYFADFPANNGIAIPTNTIRYVGIEYNAGAPIVAIRAADDFDYMTNFPAGVVTNEAGVLHLHISDRHDVSDSASHIAERFEHTAAFARDEVVGGLFLGETGTRNVTMSAGAMWQKLEKLIIPAFDSSTGSTFDIYYRDGASSFTKVAAATQWPNLQFDNGTGTLATLANNKYGTLWFYLEPDDGMLIILYGRAEHGSIAAAEVEAPPATVPNRITAGARILGKLVFAKSAATASSISSVFTATFATTGASNHSNLSNLDYASAGHTGFATAAQGALADSALQAAAIGSTIQAYDADLTTWAGVTPATGVATFLATPTLANFNTALSDADVATGGGTATGTNTGDQTATTVANTPAGSIAATTVQAAINELDTEKAPLVSPSFTTPALGTPSSGDLTSCTSNTEAAANNSTQLATTAYADRLTAGTLAGAFTTLNASTAGAQTGIIKSTNGYSLWAVQSNNATGTFGNLWLGANKFANDLAANTVAGGVVVGNQQNYPCYVMSNSTVVGEFSSTGLAVTGTIKGSTTIGVGNATPAASGAGITFPATQSASSDANTLDDYEEGTWSPSLGGNTTYTIQNGSYIKTGGVVHCQGMIMVNVLGTGATNTMSGLPFPAKSQTQGQQGMVSYFSTLAASVVMMNPSPDAGGTTVTFMTTAAATTTVSYNTAIWGNSTRIDFCLIYQV